jgi:CRISPR-associated protein Csa1
MRVFYTYDDVLRLNAMLSSLPSEVSEELRGWNWSKYPLLAPSRTQVAVSEVLGGFCESLRFVYVKKVLKEPQASVPKLEEGLLIHRTFGEAISTVKALVLKLGLRNYREFRSAFMAMLPEKEGSLSNDLRLVTQERARQIAQSLSPPNIQTNLTIGLEWTFECLGAHIEEEHLKPLITVHRAIDANSQMLPPSKRA